MDTILIVDDEEDTRLLIQERLRPEGYSFLEVNDGVQAQSMIEQHHERITAVILDWKMPKMNGLEVLRWIKDNPAYEQIPIIMHTGMTEPEHIRQGIDAGAFYYLMKGGSSELLRSIVRTAVADLNYKRTLLKQIHDSENPYQLLVEGIFRFRTLEEGEYLALRIANATPFPDKAIAISELLTNAVEHGNLNITYTEKTELIAKGLLHKTVEERLTVPEHVHKYVEVKISKQTGTMTVCIIDQGQGFDFESYLKLDEKRAFDNHGRGIAIANSTLTLQYLGDGNQVVVTIPLREHEKARSKIYA